MLQLSFCPLLELNSQTHPRRQQLICSLTCCSTELFFLPCITYQWQVHRVSNRAVIADSLCSPGHSGLYLTTNTQNRRAPSSPTPPCQPLLLSGQTWAQPTEQHSAHSPRQHSRVLPPACRDLSAISAQLSSSKPSQWRLAVRWKTFFSLHSLGARGSFSENSGPLVGFGFLFVCWVFFFFLF